MTPSCAEDADENARREGDEAPMLTMLLPISIAPMKRSRIAEQAVDDAWRACRRLFSSASMRAREAAVKRRLGRREEGRERERQRRRSTAASQRLISKRISSISGPASARRSRSSGRRATLSTLDAARDEASPDAAGEDEGQRAALHLLVLRHGVERAHRPGRSRPAHRRDASAGRRPSRWLRRAPASWPRAEPEPGREAEGEAHPDRHALAVDEAGGSRSR